MFRSTSTSRPATCRTCEGRVPEHGERANFASFGVSFFMGNAATIAKLTCGGVCHRFPRLNFVSVESGIGWIPFALSAARLAVAELRRSPASTPSTTCCRASTSSARSTAASGSSDETALQAIELLGPDNILYETDFPHPTSMSPGPASIAELPRDYVAGALAGVPDRLVAQDPARQRRTHLSRGLRTRPAQRRRDRGVPSTCTRECDEDRRRLQRVREQRHLHGFDARGLRTGRQ